MPTQPRPTNGTNQPTTSDDVRLALVEERHREVRADLTAVCSKVDDLCERLGPVIPWVTAQMTDAQSEADWRKGLIRDVKKYIITVLMVTVGTLVVTRPQETWGILVQVTKAMGGTP